MDSLRTDDITYARDTPPGEKLQEALAMMEYGLALKRASLARQHPEASDQELEDLLDQWVLLRE